ncbi:MAG TPA: hypothetical protein VI489_01480 [Candidatus Brocadiaceae bacterium]
MKIALAALIIIILGAGIFFFTQNKKDSIPQNTSSNGAIWMFDGKSWSANIMPPACTEPLVFNSPVDVSLASGILYPGQIRGGDYKAHGGFRFDSLKSNEVNVYAPFDGSLVQAARHTQGSEVQYALYFINDCGIMYKFDHLLELTDKFNKIMQTVPLKGDGDTRTTFINPSVFTSKGELVATKVGLSGNVFFDFGVYDLRQKNGVDYSTRDYYNIEQYGAYAICWLDNLEGSDKAVAKALPGADGQNGKISDYCN